MPGGQFSATHVKTLYIAFLARKQGRGQTGPLNVELNDMITSMEENEELINSGVWEILRSFTVAGLILFDCLKNLDGAWQQ